jgi:hypothetical protein
MKKCSTCKKFKELPEFNNHYKNKDGKQNGCRQCSSDASKLDSWKNNRLRRLYGVSLDEYNDMFYNQNGCCAICNKHQSELEFKLGVDHNHKTGAIRKLLCRKCNAALGLFQESEEILSKALEYIKKFNNYSLL